MTPRGKFWLFAVIGDLLIVYGWPGQSPLFYMLGGLVIAIIASELADA